MVSTPFGQITVVLEMWNSFPGPSRPTFAVVGCCKPLGWWNPQRALVAEPIDDDRREWRATFTVPMSITKIEFKWLTIDPATMEAIQLEETPLRVLPLTQMKETVRCWFDSKGTAVKVLPINLADSVDTRVEKLQQCMEEIKIYINCGLDVEIRYDYIVADVETRDDSGIDLTGNEHTTPSGDDINTASPIIPPVSTQISRVGTSVDAKVSSPGGAADHGNRTEVEDQCSSWGISWIGAVTVGLLIGGAVTAWRLCKRP